MRRLSCHEILIIVASLFQRNLSLIKARGMVVAHLVGFDYVVEGKSSAHEYFAIRLIGMSR